MESYIAKIAKKFNSKHINLFTQKNASKQFLKPFGLSLNSTCFDSSFENNRTKLTKDKEIQLFKALHFIKFKINCVLDIKKKAEQYFRIYTVLRNRAISPHVDVISICLNKISRRVKQSTDIADLKERGYMTLIYAADRFDPWRGYQFNTYAGAAVIHSFFDRKHTDKRFFESFVSINTNEEIYPIETEQHEDSNEILNGLLEVLTEREKIIIYHRFLSKKNITFKEIGKKFKIGVERSRQIQEKALKKLREQLDDQKG